MPDSELLSLTNLKAYLQITSSGSDAILTLIKDGVEAAVKKHCDRDFILTTYTEYYNGDGSSRLFVKNFPITAITTIHDDPARAFGATTQIAATYIVSDVSELLNAGIIDLLDWVFNRGKRNIKVVYQAGYSTIPSDLRNAVAKLCAREFLLQDKKLVGQVSQTVGDRTVTLNLEDMPKDVAAVLYKYTRRRVG